MTDKPTTETDQWFARRVIRGIYAITPGWEDTDRLLTAVEGVLRGGVRLLQYRGKNAAGTLPRGLRLEQLGRVKELCERVERELTEAGELVVEPDGFRQRVTLVVNDDWRMAMELGIPAVHLGKEDGAGDVGELEVVRFEISRAMGRQTLIGVTCHADLARAHSLSDQADYLAFGSVFPSGTKPHADRAALNVFTEARKLGKPLVAIGGIDATNLHTVFNAGADCVAMSGGLFAKEPS